jgi:hypothetical protein
MRARKTRSDLLLLMFGIIVAATVAAQSRSDDQETRLRHHSGWIRPGSERPVLPLYVTIYCHVEPNPQLFEAVEPGYFEQFNTAMLYHLTRTPAAVNVWGFNHHIVNVLSARLDGLGGNWAMALNFMRDIADGAADGVIKRPRPDLVRFVTMQQLSHVHEVVAGVASQ